MLSLKLAVLFATIIAVTVAIFLFDFVEAEKLHRMQTAENALLEGLRKGSLSKYQECVHESANLRDVDSFESNVVLLKILQQMDQTEQPNDVSKDSLDDLAKRTAHLRRSGEPMAVGLRFAQQADALLQQGASEKAIGFAESFAYGTGANLTQNKQLDRMFIAAKWLKNHQMSARAGAMLFEFAKRLELVPTPNWVTISQVYFNAAQMFEIARQPDRYAMALQKSQLAAARVLSPNELPLTDAGFRLAEVYIQRHQNAAALPLLQAQYQYLRSEAKDDRKLAPIAMELESRVADAYLGLGRDQDAEVAYQSVLEDALELKVANEMTTKLLEIRLCRNLAKAEKTEGIERKQYFERVDKLFDRYKSLIVANTSSGKQCLRNAYRAKARYCMENGLYEEACQNWTRWLHNAGSEFEQGQALSLLPNVAALSDAFPGGKQWRQDTLRALSAISVSRNPELAKQVKVASSILSINR